uniref:hypothetical protein n=1 Tax=Cupriavidus gilardii TaxID=82541 RepID=UPI00247AD616|nr:hypothetical protein [Cupriavidus gilardii]WDE72551.1 hypothetical protein [Cupriavidus gilardii]
MEEKHPYVKETLVSITLQLDAAKTLYRQAIDPRASDGEGPAWWSEVHAELADVLTARTVREAAAVIEWWHHDWSMVGDTAQAAATRIRNAYAGRLRRRGGTV